MTVAVREKLTSLPSNINIFPTPCPTTHHIIVKFVANKGICGIFQYQKITKNWENKPEMVYYMLGVVPEWEGGASPKALFSAQQSPSHDWKAEGTKVY